MPTGIYQRTKKWDWSEESKKKLSESKTGKPRNGNPKNWKHTLETKNKLKEKTESFMKEKGVSLETRKKLSMSNMGHSVTEETREKISKGNKGRRMSISFRNKCRQNNLGKKQSPETIAARVLRNTGLKRSIETRLKISEAHKGKKSHLWKGGITPINLKIRMSVEYKLWREEVFKRDDWICQHCRQRGGKLNADHIKPFSTYPELRFDIDNGRTLCIPCHKKTDTYARNIKRLKL